MEIPIPKTIAENIKNFTGRTWILPTILEWFEKSDERMFILTGDPGSGKSMIMSWLAGAGPTPVENEACQQLERLRDWIKAVHFCVAASGTTDPKEVARQIANQLTGNVPGFGKAMIATLGDQVQIATEQHVGRVETGGSVTGVYIANLNLGNLSEELSFNRILRDPLKLLYENGYDDPMLLLIDSLDEALTYTGVTNLVQLLAKLSDLPTKVRILVTTRNDQRVMDYFHRHLIFDLIKNAPPDIDDVKEYVVHRLLGNMKLTPAQQVDFAKRVALQAKGIFLYVSIVLNELMLKFPDIPDLETYPLPKDLSVLYSDFLIREIGTEDKGRHWHQIYKPLLGLISVAQGEGLAAVQLNALVKQDVSEYLDTCRQYLIGELPNGPFRLFHKSFADFLLEDKKNKRFHIVGEEMHKCIANYYRKKYHNNWLKCDDYGFRYLTNHLFQLNMVADYSRQLYELLASDYLEIKAQNGISAVIDDLLHGFNVAKLNGPEHLQYLFQNLLIMAGLRTLSSNLPLEFFRGLCNIGQNKQAWDMASLIPNPIQRANTLSSLSNLILESSDIPYDTSIIITEIDRLLSYQNWNHIEINNQIKSWLVQLGSNALQTAIKLTYEKIDDPYFQSLTFEELAMKKISEDSLDLLKKAQACADSVANQGGFIFSSDRLINIGRIAVYLDKVYSAQVLEKAWSSTKMHAKDYQIKFLVEQGIAIAQVMQDVDPFRAQQIIREVWDMTFSISSDITKSECYRNLFIGARKISPDVSKAALRELRDVVLQKQAELEQYTNPNSSDTILEYNNKQQLLHQVSCIRTEFVTALAVTNPDRAIEEGKLIQDYSNQLISFERVAENLAKTNLAAAFRLYLQRESSRQRPEYLKKLVTIYLSDLSVNDSHGKMIEVLDLVEMLLEGDIKRKTISLLFEELSKYLPELARILLTDILTNTPWINNIGWKKQKLEVFASESNNSEQRFLCMRQKKLNELSQAEINVIDQFKILQEQINQLFTDDDAFSHVIHELTYLNIKYVPNKSYTEQMIIDLVRKIDNLDSSHRERLIIELADSFIEIIPDRHTLISLQNRLFEMLQKPERQKEYYQIKAEITVARLLGLVLSKSPADWWNSVSTMLHKQSNHGSDHLMAVILAQWPVLPNVAGPEATRIMQEAFNAVSRRLEKMPSVLFGFARGTGIIKNR